MSVAVRSECYFGETASLVNIHAEPHLTRCMANMSAHSSSHCLKKDPTFKSIAKKNDLFGTKTICTSQLSMSYLHIIKRQYT